MVRERTIESLWSDIGFKTATLELRPEYGWRLDGEYSQGIDLFLLCPKNRLKTTWLENNKLNKMLNFRRKSMKQS